MSVSETDGRVVHYPENSEQFSFDHEVSRIFPDMAKRSIPLYQEAHRLHISMFREEIAKHDTVFFVDIGASRGGFFEELCNQFQIDASVGSPRFKGLAVDNSPHMLRLLKEEMPWVTTLCCDAACLPDLPVQAHFISMFYLIQFVKEDAGKTALLRWAYRNLADGGVLFLGQKEKEEFGFEKLIADEYYRFRRGNGYTQEEIDAKTKALKGAMWPSSRAWMQSLTETAGFMTYVETTRWLQFSTAFCVKG